MGSRKAGARISRTAKKHVIFDPRRVIGPNHVYIAAGIASNGRKDRVSRIVGDVHGRREDRASVRGPAEENLRVAERRVRPDDVDRAARVHRHSRAGRRAGITGNIMRIREGDAPVRRMAEVNKVRGAVRAGLRPDYADVAVRIHGDLRSAGPALRVL